MDIETNTLKKFLKCYLIIYLIVVFFISVILWIRTIHTTFGWDDIYILHYITTHKPHFLSVIEQGFWRPLVFAFFRVLYLIFGLSPLPFHLACIFIHTLVCILIVLMGLRMGLDLHYSILASLLFLFHPGTYFTVAQNQNVGDLFLALFSLLTIFFYLDWLISKGKKKGLFFLSLIFSVLALASKENALALILIITVMTFMGTDKKPKPLLIGFLVEVLLFSFYFIWFAFRVFISPYSYLKFGKIKFEPYVVVNFLDYLTLIINPHFYNTPTYVVDISLPDYLSWAVRSMILIVILILLYKLIAERWRMEFILLVGICGYFILPSFIYLPLDSRFLYPALPFAMLLLISLLNKINSDSLKKIILVLVVFIYLFYLPSFFWSPSVTNFVNGLNEMEKLTNFLSNYRDKIPSRATVVIRNHPLSYWDPASGSYYGRRWIELYFPDKKWQISFDKNAKTNNSTTFVLQWNGKILFLIEKDSTNKI